MVMVAFNATVEIWHQIALLLIASPPKSEMAPTRAIILKQIFQIRKERRLRQLRILHYILSRRKKILQLCLTLLVVTSSKPETPLRIRSCRRLERTTNWWNSLWASYSEKRFRNTFRMPRNVFTLIHCRLIRRKSTKRKQRYWLGKLFFLAKASYNLQILII